MRTLSRVAAQAAGQVGEGAADVGWFGPSAATMPTPSGGRSLTRLAKGVVLVGRRVEAPSTVAIGVGPADRRRKRQGKDIWWRRSRRRPPVNGATR
jgi:hypothetical protein